MRLPGSRTTLVPGISALSPPSRRGAGKHAIGHDSHERGAATSDKSPRHQHPMHLVHRVTAALWKWSCGCSRDWGSPTGWRFPPRQANRCSACPATACSRRSRWWPGCSCSPRVPGAGRWPPRSPRGSVCCSRCPGSRIWPSWGTAFNILAFRPLNVFFSLLVGMLLLFAGTSVRVFGDLLGHPYRRERTAHARCRNGAGWGTCHHRASRSGRARAGPTPESRARPRLPPDVRSRCPRGAEHRPRRSNRIVMHDAREDGVSSTDPDSFTGGASWWSRHVAVAVLGRSGTDASPFRRKYPAAATFHHSGSVWSNTTHVSTGPRRSIGSSAGSPTPFTPCWTGERASCAERFAASRSPVVSGASLFLLSPDRHQYSYEHGSSQG